jgi:hypothetical protein
LVAAILALASLIPFPAWADARSDAVWQSFRRQNPFHSQIVGLTAADDVRNERILLISEPPPLLPRQSYREALASIFGSALKEATLRRNQIGYDGWAEDVVACLVYPATPQGDRTLKEDMTRLAQHLFGTAYKFAPILLEDPETDHAPWPARGPALAPPSLDVTAAELKTWLLGPGREVKALDAGTEGALDNLLKDGPPGVYLSPERGLVILLLPRDQMLQAYRADIRKFALDTDAIIGAIASGDRRVAIIGRERDTPLSAMPPLRSETVLSLAATQSDRELAQSYERTAVFAGKLSEGDEKGRDWAPIYLSKDLYNTEFGSLLNVTDQLLKSWSMSNLIKYVNFDYTKPATLPFDKPVIKILKTNEITFNWNTIGVGSVSTVDGFQIFALNRTGSLPVSYCPGENCSEEKSADVIAAEENAYNWFSGQRDPYLARAVEYTALYQIFRVFKVPAKADEEPPKNYQVATARLIDQTGVMLARLMSFAASDRVSGDVPEEVRSLSKALWDVQDKCGPTAIRLLAVAIADRNNDAAQHSVECHGEPLTPLWKVKDEAHEVLSELQGVDTVRLDVVRAAREIETGYIKTPSIVLSWPLGISGTGGHNLYSKATRIETSSSIPRGQVRIDSSGGRVLMINPDDAEHSNALARAYERNAARSDSEVTEILQRELATFRAIRPMPEGLRLAGMASGERRGLTAAAEGDLAVGEIGTFPAPSSADVVGRFEQVAAENQYDVVLARDGDNYVVVRFQPRPPTSVRAPTEPAMLEALSEMSGQAARLRLPSGLPPIRLGVTGGYSEGELRAVMQTEQLRTAAGGGGGWKPPRPPHDFTGFPPEPDRMNGFFYRAEDARNGGGAGGGGGGNGAGGGSDGYHGFGRDGEDVQLKLAAKDVALGREMMLKRIDWNKAKITTIEPVSVSGELASMHQIGFEIELPLRDPPWLERTGIKTAQPFYMRVIAFFRSEPSAADTVKSKELITAVLQQNATDGLLPIDGVARLKHEIMQSLSPDDLRFYNRYSSGDVMIVRQDAGQGKNERNSS